MSDWPNGIRGGLRSERRRRQSRGAVKAPVQVDPYADTQPPPSSISICTCPIPYRHDGPCVRNPKDPTP